MKMQIIKIGYVDENNNPRDWEFDAQYQSIPAFEITDDGMFLWAGYTVDELRKICMMMN